MNLRPSILYLCLLQLIFFATCYGSPQDNGLHIDKNGATITGESSTVAANGDGFTANNGHGGGVTATGDGLDITSSNSAAQKLSIDGTFSFIVLGIATFMMV